jgi:F-type H+-transporting ATPase subunit a
MIHSFEWYTLVPGINKLVPHVAHALLVAVVLLTMALLANRRLVAAAEEIVPSRKLSLTNFFESVYDSLLAMMEGILGHHASNYIHLIGALAFFILFSNLLGLIPGFAPPTDNINTPAACAVVVFLATHYYGLKSQGLKYFKQFLGPIWWLSPLLLPIEIISHLARPLSLTLRLTGNMFGDHLVVSIFVLMSAQMATAIVNGPVLIWPLSLLTPLVPFFVVLLGILVSFIQTYVFILLAMTYISGAIHEH